MYLNKNGTVVTIPVPRFEDNRDISNCLNDTSFEVLEQSKGILSLMSSTVLLSIPVKKKGQISKSGSIIETHAP